MEFFLIEKIDSKITDPNPLQAFLQRCSVFEFDMDPMITTPWNDPRRLIPSGRSESQPHIFGLGPCTDSDRQPRLRRLSLRSRAADVLRRFEKMKMEINEWKISAKSQLISMDVICERAKILTRLSQELAKEAIMTEVDLSLCRRISDY